MTLIHFPRGRRVAYQHLTRIVKQHFATQQQARTGDARLYRKAVTITLMFIASFSAIYLLPQAWNWVAWLAHGIATALVGFNIMHDGAHGSFSRSTLLNRIAALSFNLIGSNRFYWAQKHNRNHHTFTNIDDLDEDIDSFGLFRMSPHQKHFFFHRWQHLYAWFLYPLTSLFWFFVLDYKAYLTQRIGDRAFTPRMGHYNHLEFWLSKLLYIALYLLLPASVFGWENTLSGFLIMQAVVGCLFAVVFQLAHVVEKAEFPLPQQSEEHFGELENEWAIHQLRTTVDFATDNRFLTWALGGLNFQVEHHLFPGVSHIHYPQLHKLLQSECQQSGYPIRTYDTLFAALKGHYRHMKTMGQPAC